MRLTQFTGSSGVANKLSEVTRGKVRCEDAGFNWKVLGPDVQASVQHTAWVCDQDAYAASGQKCSAQSSLFVHENWLKTDLLARIQALAKRRNLEALTIGPVLSWSTQRMLDHVGAVLSAVPNASLLFGGKPLQGHAIPEPYGAIEPTAIRMRLADLMSSPKAFELATTEVFGPVQIVVDYAHGASLSGVCVRACPLTLPGHNRRGAHAFGGSGAHGPPPHRRRRVVRAGVPAPGAFAHRQRHHRTRGNVAPLGKKRLTRARGQYAGTRARCVTACATGARRANGAARVRENRTTGAPTNHWFGPAGDPRAAGIGSPEAILSVWSCHREIVRDELPVDAAWTLPEAT